MRLAWLLALVLAALPDSSLAQSEYQQPPRVNADDLAISFVAGRYIDRYEDRGTGWKIAKRQELIDWARTDPASDSFLRETPALQRIMGARGAADFSNQRNWP